MGGHLRHVMFDGCIIGMNNQWVSNAPLSWAHGVLLLPNCQGHILHRHCHRGSGTCPQNGLKLKWHHANSQTTFDMSSYSVQENDGNHTKKTLWNFGHVSTEDYVSMTYYETPSLSPAWWRSCCLVLGRFLGHWWKVKRSLWDSTATTKIMLIFDKANI